MTEYSRYDIPQVRALVWCLISPGLVKESAVYPACASQQWCQDIYAILQPFLAQLDKQPAPLIEWLERQKSWRLGIRFEAYWSFILESLKNKAELKRYKSHIQVQENDPRKTYDQTMGEMDFVFQDKLKQLNHLELAVKFYCLKPDEFGFERLIGPNSNDWLERKLEHLFNKQLMLSNTQQGQKKLNDLFFLDQAAIENHSDCQHIGLVKGMIFLPVTAETELNDNEQAYINSNFLTGKWGTKDNWYLSDPGETGRWVMLEKLDWLVPQIYSSFYSNLEDHLYTAKEIAYKLRIHFNNTRRSVLIVHLQYEEAKSLWVEYQRVMVVDPYWPSFKRPEK
jgi:hypothetical protein